MDRPAVPPSPYLIAGLGRAGIAAARRLAAAEADAPIFAWDAADTPRTRAVSAKLAERGVEVELGGSGTKLLGRAATLVKSPGIPMTTALLAAARARGAEVIDELELGWRLDDRPFVAVTGTNGKSTVAAMLAAVLHAAGGRPAVVGNTQIGPPVSALARDVADVVVAEVSSFQLESCDSFLPDLALFTNLTEDHLDRHRTMAAYEAVKQRMFTRGQRCAPLAVVNADDPAGRRIAPRARELGGRVVSAGRARDATVHLERYAEREGGSALTVQAPSGELALELAVPGVHNALNAVVALAGAVALRCDGGASAEAIAHAELPPGRFERVDVGQPFVAAVDFAHNLAGVRCALEAARELLAGGRLHAVVGALAPATTEDQRRGMGRMAAELADDVIVTVDPFFGDERDRTVVAGLAEAAREAGSCTAIPDRAAAIREAVGRAHMGDVVMVLGRGMRTGVAGGGSFDDRLVLGDAIAERASGGDAARTCASGV
jgi:UDP-N-acetylmuramoyl-L-alanyl-D-glutamate--2,6-diaminopimelate ligase